MSRFVPDKLTVSLATNGSSGTLLEPFEWVESFTYFILRVILHSHSKVWRQFVVQHACIIFKESGSTDIYNVTKVLPFKKGKIKSNQTESKLLNSGVYYISNTMVMGILEFLKFSND